MVIKFSAHSELYDMLIPVDEMLRLINDRVDFSFVYDELKDKYCPDNGRNAISPITMFKYLFLKVHTGLSDKDLVKRVKTDLAFKYFLDMTPEEMPIDPSSLSVFRRQRLLDGNMLDLLIEKTVSLAITKGIIKKKTDVIIDATHTVSKYNPHHSNDALKALSKKLRRKQLHTVQLRHQEMPCLPAEKQMPETREREEQIHKRSVSEINVPLRLLFIHKNKPLCPHSPSARRKKTRPPLFWNLSRNWLSMKNLPMRWRLPRRDFTRHSSCATKRR